MNTADYIMLGITATIGILTIIEKSKKLKIKPITWLLGRENINNKIDALTEKISNMHIDLCNINDRELNHYKQQAKIFISDFAADLRKCKKENILKVKSKGQFCSIIDLCNEYMDKGWNSEVRHDAEYIEEIFDSLKNKM